MHFLRRWKRWYNQSQKIAQNLSEICKIPVENNLIRRVKYTKQQSHLSQIDRAKNLSGVFSINTSVVDKNSTIYLVDDVISTWSTVLKIANLLYVNGYTKVKVAALASD
jgi:ComF family protein